MVWGRGVDQHDASVVVWPELHPEGFAVAYYGWPWCDTFVPLSSAAKVPHFGNVHVPPWGYRALAEDAAVGVVLVVVLTWASSLLLRRVTPSVTSPTARTTVRLALRWRVTEAAIVEASFYVGAG